MKDMTYIEDPAIYMKLTELIVNIAWEMCMIRVHSITFSYRNTSTGLFDLQHKESSHKLRYQ